MSHADISESRAQVYVRDHDSDFPGACIGEQKMESLHQRALRSTAELSDDVLAIEGWQGVSESAVSAKRGWGSFGAKPARSETPVRAAAKRRPPGRGRSGDKDGGAL
jgi:hypothetical protein